MRERHFVAGNDTDGTPTIFNALAFELSSGIFACRLWLAFCSKGSLLEANLPRLLAAEPGSTGSPPSNEYRSDQVTSLSLKRVSVAPHDDCELASALPMPIPSSLTNILSQ